MNFNDGIDGLVGISIAIAGALTVSFLIALISPLLSLAIIAWFVYLIYKKKVDGDYRMLLYIAIGFLTFPCSSYRYSCLMKSVNSAMEAAPHPNKK